MKKLLLIIILLPFCLFSQTQIGDDLIGEFENDLFGSSVALSEDGTFLVVGSISNSETGASAGQVQVFENVNDSWVQLGQDINGDEAGSNLGRGVSISDDGTIIALGADGDDNFRGSVRVFELDNGSWVQIGQEIVGINAVGFFGNEVALSSDGTIVAVGAPTSLGNDGSAHVFQNQGGSWVQLGDDINGDVTGGLFGNGLGISSDGLTVAIGGDGSTGVGTLRMFQYTGENWEQVGQTIVGEDSLDRLGSNVAMSDDGTIVAASALGNEALGPNTGAARVYQNIGGTWVQIGEDIIGENLNDQFGASVSLSSDGGLIAVGSFGSENERIFQNINDNWVELANIPGETDSFFGLQSHLSKDGLTVSVGAQSFDGNGSNRGLARVYDIEELVLAVDDVQQNGLSLFPNPTSGIVTINTQNNELLKEVIVYNTLGQKLLSFTSAVIDISSLSTGIYHLEIIGTNSKWVQSVIVN